MIPEAAETAMYALPVGATDIVGREEIITDVRQKMTDRLVSLVGPGGIGKTTVAVAVASSLLKDFGGAVCFLELSAVARRVQQPIAFDRRGVR